MHECNFGLDKDGLNKKLQFKLGFVKIAVLALVIALFPTSAFSATKIISGSVCKSLNQKTVYLNKTYTCVKSGKKLIWNKGIVIVKPTPTPTPTYTQAPIAPTSFEDLQSHLDGIIYGAWLKSSQKIQNSTSMLGNVKILVGPNTKEDDTNSLVALNLASKLYSNLKQAKTLYVIKFSLADVAWAQQQYDLFHAINYYATGASDICNFLYCNGASSGINNKGEGVILAGQGDRFSVRSSSGQVVAHEYSHTLQFANAACGIKTCAWDVPPWLREGGAEWSGTASRYSGNFNDYLAARKLDVATEYSLSYKYTADYITKFLNPDPYLSSKQFDWYYWDKYDSWTSYSIGFMVNEILVNIKSPEAVMKIYLHMGEGKSFIEGFQEEFGMAWSDACPIIAKAIASEIELNIQK